MYRHPKRLAKRLQTGGYATVSFFVGPAKLVGKTAITVLTIATLILGFVKYRDDLNKGAQAINLDFEIPPFELSLNMDISLDPAQEQRIIDAIRE